MSLLEAYYCTVQYSKNPIGMLAWAELASVVKLIQSAPDRRNWLPLLNLSCTSPMKQGREGALGL